ncbi:hypothetical protein U9M48_005338 [Paspalum notatum var. saurae]|uniref:Uncharacterized protein n=1 Tax=Paspalum notatum var. saurae TaxID=547442 RepID=A0AAQ3SJU0_PASNO
MLIVHWYRDDLVFQCVAEGFTSGVHGRDAVEVARGYLNELVNRSMIIQCVEHVLRGPRGDHISYRVHDMVLDLILSRSTEENFLCVVQNLQSIGMRQQYKARRLSLQFDGRSLVESAARISLMHVRSLIIFPWPLCSLGLLELRALDDLDLTLIGKLFQLRYLCISGNYERLQLPKEISGIQHLEALKIVSFGLSSVPRDIVYLPALLYLQFPPGAVFPDGIGNLNRLHTLRKFDPSKQSVANICALGELLNLRVPELWINGVSFATKAAHIDALLSSLEKLIGSNMKNLSIISPDENMGHHDRWSSLCFPYSHLEQLDLSRIRFPRMPSWVCQLRTLSSLEIDVVELCQDDVAAFAGLPALAHLVLCAQNVPRGGVVFSTGTTFMVLGYLRIPDVAAKVGITFEAGSMPQAEVLRFHLRADYVMRHGVKLAGIEHLPKLKQVIVYVRFRGCAESERPVTKAAIQGAFDPHPSCSKIKTPKINQTYG